MECNSIARSPCQCIKHLRVSSLRQAFERTCQFLSQNDWQTLVHHFESCQMLANIDIAAITFTSTLPMQTQAKEMLLRLEDRMRKEQNMDFTVEVFLRHASNILPFQHFSFLKENYVDLHMPQCSVLFMNTHMNAMSFPHSLPSQEPHLLQDTRDIGIFSHDQCSSLGPTSMNNLSDPYEPYLHITKHPVDTVISLQDDLILRCLAESDEEILYTWKKDGKPISGMNDKILVLQNFKDEDVGHYVCVAITKHHEAESRIAKVLIKEDEPSNSLYFATDKFALLIANERYTHNPRLRSASNDVDALASTLRDKLNFKTMALVNLNLNEMVKAVKLFCRQLVDGAYCVTYLAGHGFENDGQCYIVPTDAPDRYDSRSCFSIQKLIYDIRKSCNLSLSVFLLDVCRRRNKNAVHLPEQDNRIEKSGNFVISFATMEHGMAYEVKGRDLGVYVTSLQKYLDRDKRVTRVLELVHKDIHKNWVTRGFQQPEFKSNMFEDRKLGDPINGNSCHLQLTQIDSPWLSLHTPCKPTLFIFESCGAEVELHKKYLFSNILSIEVKIIEKGFTESCSALIALRKQPDNASDTDNQTTCNQLCFEIENLQRLHGDVLYFTLFLQYKLGTSEDVFHEKWDDAMTISFLSWWNS